MSGSPPRWTRRSRERAFSVETGDGRRALEAIYPGWYAGRAVHVHFKIRRPGAGGRADEFTSQLYFDDALADRTHATAPYASKKGQRLFNARDMILREGGTKLILPVTTSGSGYAATFRIAMRPGEPAAPGPRGRGFDRGFGGGPSV